MQFFFSLLGALTAALLVAQGGAESDGGAKGSEGCGFITVTRLISSLPTSIGSNNAESASPKMYSNENTKTQDANSDSRALVGATIVTGKVGEQVIEETFVPTTYTQFKTVTDIITTTVVNSQGTTVTIVVGPLGVGWKPFDQPTNAPALSSLSVLPSVLPSILPTDTSVSKGDDHSISSSHLLRVSSQPEATGQPLGASSQALGAPTQPPEVSSQRQGASSQALGASSQSEITNQPLKASSQPSGASSQPPGALSQSKDSGQSEASSQIEPSSQPLSSSQSGPSIKPEASSQNEQTVLTSMVGSQKITEIFVPTTIISLASLTSITTSIITNAQSSVETLVIGPSGVAWKPVNQAPSGVPQLGPPTIPPENHHMTPLTQPGSSPEVSSAPQTQPMSSAIASDAAQSSVSGAFDDPKQSETTIVAGGTTLHYSKETIASLSNLKAPTTITTPM